MVIPIQLARANRRAPWLVALALVTWLVPAVAAADPFADSFTAADRKHHTHRPAKKPSRKPATKHKPARSVRSKRRAPARSAHHAAHARETEAPFARGAEAPQPTREAPESGEREEPAEAPRTEERAEERTDERTDAGAETPAPEPRAAEEDRPRSRRAPSAHRKRRRASDEEGDGADESEDQDEDAYRPPAARMPVVEPRLFSLLLGGTMMGRSFHFDVPLQRESAFPRIGYEAAIVTYPLRVLDEGWYRDIGLSASYAAEGGKAQVTQTNGMSNSTSVKQARWHLDVNYALALGSRVTLMPYLGLGGSSYTLETSMPVMASDCAVTATMACLPNTHVLLVQPGVRIRLGVTKGLAVTAEGALLEALQVGNKPLDEIGYETRTSAAGFAAAAGVTYLLTDYLAIHGELPITRLTYSFHNPPDTPYKSATETTYGVNLGLAVFAD